MKKKGKISPNAGGCWFCWSIEGELDFSREFDTYVHPKCIDEVLDEDVTHPEAQIMKAEGI